MEIEHESNNIKIHQMNYIHTLFHQHEMQDCNLMNMPMNSSIKLTAIMDSDVKIDSSQYQQYIDELMFAAIVIYPNIIFIVSQFFSYNSNPCQRHIVMIKYILRYLKGTVNLGIVYKR